MNDSHKIDKQSKIKKNNKKNFLERKKKTEGEEEERKREEKEKRQGKPASNDDAEVGHINIMMSHQSASVYSFIHSLIH